MDQAEIEEIAAAFEQLGECVMREWERRNPWGLAPPFEKEALGEWVLIDDDDAVLHETDLLYGGIRGGRLQRARDWLVSRASRLARAIDRAYTIYRYPSLKYVIMLLESDEWNTFLTECMRAEAARNRDISASAPVDQHDESETLQVVADPTSSTDLETNRPKSEEGESIKSSTLKRRTSKYV